MRLLGIVRPKYILIPISFTVFTRVEGTTRYAWRELLVFGIRLAYWTIYPIQHSE